MSTYSLDSQPYAVLDDPRRLQVVSLPGRQALIQRMTVDIGTAGADPPNLLRVLVRAEQETPPAASLRIRVTDITGVDLVEPQDVSPSVLSRLRMWQFVEVPVVPTVGFGSGSDKEVLIWFTVSERGPGWEVAAPNTGENVPDWRGPLNGTDPDIPVFGNLLTFPAAASVLTRLSGATLTGDTGPVTAGELVSGDPVLASHYVAAAIRNSVTSTVTTSNRDVTIDGSHAYFAGAVSGRTAIRKYLRDPFQWVNTVTSSISTELQSRSITADSGFAYIGTGQSPARLVKFDLAGSMSRVGGLALASGENSLSQLVNDGTHVYGVTYTTPARVVKVRMSDLIRVGSATLSSGENLGEGIAISPDGSTLYAVTNTDPLKIVRLDPAGGTPVFRRETAITFPSGENYPTSFLREGQFGYIGLQANKIVKVNLNTMTRVGALTLNVGEGTLTGAVSDGTHGYFASESDDSLIKVNLSTFTRVAAVAFPVNENPRSVITDGTYAYVGIAPSSVGPPGKVYKIDLATMTNVGSLTLNSGEENPASAVTDGTYGYFVTRTSPSKVVKIDLSTMTRVGALTLGAGDDYAAKTIIVGTNAYIATNTLSPERIIKVDLSTMTRTSALDLNAGESFPQSLMSDGTYGYVDVGFAPCKIVKFDLSTMARVATVTLPADEDLGGVGTTDGVSGYFALNTLPIKLVKVNFADAPPSRTDAITYGTAGLGIGSRIDLAPDGTWGTVVTFGGHAIRFTTSPFQFTGDDSAGSPSRPALRDVKIDSEGRGIYAISDESPVRVRRYEQSGSDLVRIGDGLMPSTVDEGWGLALDDRHAFVAADGLTTPVTSRATTALTVVSDVDPTSLTNAPILEVPYFDSAEGAVGVHVDGDDVFVASVDGIVSKYDSTDGSRGARYASANDLSSFRADATHLYVTEDVSPSVVRKLAQTDLSSVDNLTLNSGEQVGVGAVVDDGTHLYYGTNQSPASIVKVAMSTLARTAALTLNTNENLVRALALDGTDLYACTNTAPIRVVKVATGAMTRTSAITLEAGENSARAAVVEDGNLYVLTDTLPARVVEIDLSTFTRTNAATLSSDETNGRVLLSDDPPVRVWAGLATTPGRVARLGETLAATGTAHALQINSEEDADAGLDYDRNFREDADVVVQFGQKPSAPEQVTAVVDIPPDDSGCLREVTVEWQLPDDECSTVAGGGYVEVQREGPYGWISVYRVFDDVTRSVTDVEVMRNRVNRYRLRIVNDAGFVSDWTAPVEVNVESECCGYVFASNRFPDRSVWYDDIGGRSYRFVETVDYVEFEGVDGSVPLRPDADRLDEFDAQLMVAGFGVFGGTTDANDLTEIGRRLFRPLTNLAGNKRTTGGALLRAPYVAVADDKGHLWFAEVQTPSGEVVAEAGRYILSVKVKEVTRNPAPVDLSAVLEPAVGGGDSDLLLLDPSNLLGS